MAETKKTRAPRKPKTAAAILAELEKTKAKLAELESAAYAEQISEAIGKTKIVSDFNAIKAQVSNATEIAILAAIGKAVGIARLEVTQKPAVKRAPRKQQ